MSKFYTDSYAAAVAAKTSLESSQSTRAAATAFVSALQSAITGLVNQGKFACLLQGAEDLKTTNTVRLGSAPISSGEQKFDVIEIAPELLDAVAKRFEQPFNFYVTKYAVGVWKISWESATARPVPTNTPA